FALELFVMTGVCPSWMRRGNADGRALDEIGAADRGLPSQGQDPAPGSAAHAVGDPLAASERGQVARHSGGAGALVTGGADLHSLGPPGRVGAPAAPGPRARGPTRDD